MERAVEQAEAGDDHHLVSRVRTLLTHIEEGHDSVDQRVSEAVSEVDHPLVNAVPALKLWIEEDDYQEGAVPALDYLESAVDRAKDRGNQSIAVFGYEKLLRLQLSIGRDAGDTFESIVEFLEDSFDGEDIHLGLFHDLIDLILEHSDQVGDGLLERCIDVCIERREIQHRRGNYRGERDTLNQITDLKQCLDQEVDEEQDALVAAFQSEIDRRSSSQGKGAILKEAIVECKQFLSDEKEEEWKRELREENRRAVEEEFAEIAPPDDVLEDLQEEAEHNVERIVDWFRNKSEDEPKTYILYCLLKSNGYFPDWETIEDIESEAPITSIFPRVIISQEGDPIETEDTPFSDGDVERIPQSYKVQMRHFNRILANALYRLIESGDISSENFTHLLSITDRLSPDDQLFLTDLISAVFEERYSEAIHLGMSRMESVATTLLEKTGQSMTSVDGNDIQQAGLGGLLRTVEDEYSDEVGYYLRVKYAEKAGQNLRNRTNHGQLKYAECNFMTAILLLFDIFQLITTLTESEYTTKFPVRRYGIGSRSRE